MNDEDNTEDLDAISDMLKAAHEQGLLVEVVWSFHASAKSGNDIQAAAASALYEWDI